MQALGDDITLTPPDDAVIATRCVLSARPGSGDPDSYNWTDNIWAKVDIASIIVEMLESAAPGIAKTWTADYFGLTYVVTEVFPKGDGTIAVVLNQPGNSITTNGEWR